MKDLSLAIDKIGKRGRLALVLSCSALISLNPAAAAPPGEVPFGVYDPDGDFESDPDVTIEHLFLPWEDVFLPSLVDADVYAKERNRAILATVEPWTWSRSERNTAEILKRNLASGEYDQYMRGICAVLGTMESPVTVRWAQEMDDYTSQFIWAGWAPEDYISAYQRVVDICRAEAPNAQFMWSPLGYENLQEFYPGDDYVDLVGVSVFGLQAWEQEKFGKDLSFVDILTPRYERVVGFGKPIVVAELGYVGDSAYVAKWESEVRQLYPQFEELVGVVYFNQHEVYPWPDGFGLPDWRIDERVTDQ